MISMQDIYLYFGIIGFVLALPIPLFARRFGKFLPADAGTALVRSFHIPRFAKPEKSHRYAERKQLWRILLFASFKWGVLGAVAAIGLIYFQYSILLYVCLWICGLLACVDEKLHLLPDVLTIPLLILGFFFSTVSFSMIDPVTSAAGAIGGFILPTITSALMTPFRPRSLGGGDFKMLAAVGAWIGFLGLSLAILLSFFYFTLIAIIRREKEGPYGTALVLGIVTALILMSFPAIRGLFIV